jgi:hypothetical protein
MPSSYKSIILFPLANFGLDQAQTALAERGWLAVQREGDALIVKPKHDDNPVLRVRFASGDAVQRSTNAIAMTTPHGERVRLCTARFEITFDDLDEVLDEINTLIEAQLTLQDATKGFLFNTWNNSLSPPEAS